MVSFYKPLKITGNETGLVQNREEFLLPNDAYPVLQNAYVWRERIKRKQGCKLIGRLRRAFTNVSIGNSGASPWSFNIFSSVTPAITEPTATLRPGNIVIRIGMGPGIVFNDTPKNGTLISITPGNSGTIDYVTGDVTLIHTAGAGVATVIAFSYYPGLPVMGIRTRETQTSTFIQTVAFDQVYAYNFNGTDWQEWIPGTTWNANGDGVDGVDFFWSTNYWVANGNRKVFWVTNNSWIGPADPGDPIRYTDSTAWEDFSPSINSAGDVLVSCLALLPFRGRLLAFNTVEGPDPTDATTLRYSNRIRWSAIGTPFDTASTIVTIVDPNAWRDDIRGKGGFLNIPTSEDIVSVGFVRDNLVIYCERSTWQLRYTGRTIAPFQIEKVNSENGTESTFSTIQFDTSLLGIGDKGILECDSFKSELIDVKIPDLVFNLQNKNNGPLRIHGVRDFERRLAYWTIPRIAAPPNEIFPNQRLVYNYENDSWALFTDSFTCLGTMQVPTSQNWINTPNAWIQLNYPWIQPNINDPIIVGGNQQGFVEQLDKFTYNDISLYIQDIIGNTTTATQVISPDHNLPTGTIVEISGIPTGTPFENLNGGIFYVASPGRNTFLLQVYDPLTGEFSSPQLDLPGVFVGIGNIAVRDNFNIVSKKFNFIDEGQSIQLGYIDILMDASEAPLDGAISLNVYLDYEDTKPSNIQPQNASQDTCFNSVIPTTSSNLNNKGGTKFWQRVFCPTRANFLTLEYKFSNAQMASLSSKTDVQIDAQVLWIRPAGRMTQI